jgi:uncharacterized protein
MTGTPKDDQSGRHGPFPSLVQVALTVVAGTYSVCRLGPDAPLPAWAAGGPLVSVTRTPDETSVVCPAAAVPAGVRCEGGWRCLRVAGPLDFGMVGVLAGLVGPLAAAGLSVFVVSTFDTDYLLVKEERFDAAVGVLRRSGHVVAAPLP